MSSTQRCIVLRSYPHGVPSASNFECVERALPELVPGQVLIETRYLSMDPVTRMRMNAEAKPVPMALNDVVSGRGAGIVRQSLDANFLPGDAVAGELGWQEYAVMAGPALRKVDMSLGPLQASLGVLGPSGIAAWCLTHAAASVRPNETVVVTAAAGAVGSVAVQLARIAGARAVAIVGSAAQACFARDELGAAAVIDYSAATLDRDLAAACPNGVDVFLDSVGGTLHNAVMRHIAVRARIIAFGYISSYNSAPGQLAEYGSIYQLIHRRAELRGFLVADYASRFGEALQELAAHLSAGRLRNFETCIDGIDNAPRAFVALFSGEPIGKQLVRVAVTSKNGMS